MVTNEPNALAGARATQLLRTELPDAIVEVKEAFGEQTVVIKCEYLVKVCKLLRDHPEALYKLPLFVTAVDLLDFDPEAPRFEIVYQLRSLEFNDVCRLVVRVSESNPTVPTLEEVFVGMDWHEREAYDLLGIEFIGHHNLARILLPEDWTGHPLRKDYVSFGEPVAFTHNIAWALPSQERSEDMPGSLENG